MALLVSMDGRKGSKRDFKGIELEHTLKKWGASE